MRPWFRRKTCGYGWTPCSWEGWVATLLFALGILGIADPGLLPLSPAERVVCGVALVAVLFAVTLATSGRDGDSTLESAPVQGGVCEKAGLPHLGAWIAIVAALTAFWASRQH